MSRRYAEGTEVPIERTLAEIGGMLGGIGVTQQMTMQDTAQYVVAFVVNGVAYRLSVPKPDPNEQRFTRVKVNATSWKPATAEQQADKVKQEMARRMRALGALIKARLVAIEEGIQTVEQAFVGDIVVGSQGQTLAEVALPQVMQAIEKGQAPGNLALPWSGK